MSNAFRQIRPTNLRDEVVQQVRTAIIEGRLKPGDHIVEKSLTTELGVSRTPVREALILLERENLVNAEPNRGFFVRVFAQSDIDHIFSMRTVLENFAAERIIDTLDDDDYTHLENFIKRQERLIAERNVREVRAVDMAFHEYFIETARHPLLMRSWSELVAQIAAVLFIRAEAIPDYEEQLAIVDHRRILQAYRQRDLAAVKGLNKSINQRVADECRFSVNQLNRSNS